MSDESESKKLLGQREIIKTKWHKRIEDMSMKEIDELGDDFYVKQFKDNGRLHIQRLKKYDAGMKEMDELGAFLDRWKEIYLHVSSQLTEKEIRVYNSLTRTRIKKLKTLNEDVDIVLEDIAEFEKDIESQFVSDDSGKKKAEKWKDTIPYQVMRKFATGEIQELSKQNLSAPEIAKKLFPQTKPEAFRPYISDSLGENKYRGGKSIFSLNSSYQRCSIVAEELKKEGKEVSPDFIAIMNEIKPD
ncbi:hypothetical protein [Flagellimonas sp. SN16]|uniref:hypothetical protein n=1 Tax=Flagellimonas sp. SN16 TaxID=3415142 RepID=UPI003C5B5D2A